jgi:hypothetical protein
LKVLLKFARELESLKDFIKDPNKKEEIEQIKKKLMAKAIHLLQKIGI